MYRVGDTPGVDDPVFDSGFSKNIIMDRFFTDLSTGNFGLAMAIEGSAASGGAALSSNMAAGTGNANVLRVDSSPVTVSQSGTTVTASGAFFTSGMVGRLLVFGGSGVGTNPCYITAFTDSTHVTVSTTASVSSIVCSIYTVAGWTLTGTVSSSSVVPTTAGLQGTSYSAGVYTYTTTRQWAPVASPITFLQLRLTDTGSNIIAGFQIPGAGDTVGVGFFYLVTWTFNMTVTPNAPTAVGNIGSGINTAGNVMIESLRWFSTINSSGTTAGGGLDGVGANVNNLPGNNIGQLVAGAYTQNASILASGSEPAFTNVTGYATSTGSAVYSAPANTGTAVNAFSWAFNTTGNGASITALAAVTPTRLVDFDVQLTSPYSSPGSGTFTFTFTFTVTIGRTVTN